ncbi:MAG: S1C family serine protease, partial [Actinomycetota bacterium]
PHEDRIVQVVRRVSPAVVNVTSNFSSSIEGDGEGEGTGFVVRSDGVIVTNFHVLEAPAGATLRGIEVVTADGRNLQARLIGGDANADLAVLKVTTEEPLATVPLGDASGLQLGEPVVALGFALGLEGGPSVTSGILSARHRTIRAGAPGGQTRTYEDLLQTDAAINPGNSGGPLVDLSGRVVGINTAGVGAGSAENIGFAIAIDRAKPVIEEAMRDPVEQQAFLGVSTSDVDAAVAAQLGLSVKEGALVQEVVPGGPADRGGVAIGDVIVSIAGESVDSSVAVGEVLADLDPGNEVDVVVVTPEGDERTLRVTLGVRPLPVEEG